MRHGIVIPRFRPGRKLVEDLHEGGFVECATETGPEYVRPKPGADVDDLLGVPGSGRLRRAKWMALCATCVHARRATDAGADVCGEVCGGPSAGLAYPRYTGLPRDVWERVCYVCGADGEFGLMRPGWPKPLSCCGRHRPEGMVR